MRKYEYNGKIESMKTLPSEITIQEFRGITKNQDLSGTFMYYLNTFEELGLSQEFVDRMDDQTLYSLIRDFQEDFQVENNSYQKTIWVEGYEYQAYEDEFKLGARDLARIEEEMHKDPLGWITFALAIIFKRTDLTSTEHNAPAHIKHKEKLFGGLTMEVALPYIMYVSESYINNVKLIAGV